MARRKRGTPEQQARRALISELLSAANVQSIHAHVVLISSLILISRDHSNNQHPKAAACIIRRRRFESILFDPGKTFENHNKVFLIGYAGTIHIRAADAFLRDGN